MRTKKRQLVGGRAELHKTGGQNGGHFQDPHRTDRDRATAGTKRMNHATNESVENPTTRNVKTP